MRGWYSIWRCFNINDIYILSKYSVSFVGAITTPKTLIAKIEFILLCVCFWMTSLSLRTLPKWRFKQAIYEYGLIQSQQENEAFSQKYEKLDYFAIFYLNAVEIIKINKVMFKGQCLLCSSFGLIFMSQCLQLANQGSPKMGFCIKVWTHWIHNLLKQSQGCNRSGRKWSGKKYSSSENLILGSSSV